MSDGTSIEWADATWSVSYGCSRVSEGCRHCYAERFSHRGLAPEHRGLTVWRAGGPGWTGEVRLAPQNLPLPLRWRKPRRVFVNSMSDLFHPAVPFEYVAAVFGVMAACPQHTFLVLTKRPQRALEFSAWLSRAASANRETPLGWCLCHAANHLAGEEWSRAVERAGFNSDLGDDPWPLHGVHLGVSAEDQSTWNERTAILRDVPNACPWVSYEPALGEVDPSNALDFIRWIVVGGESGPGARTFDVGWARAILDRCHSTNTRVFVKQLGARPIDDLLCNDDSQIRLRDRKGKDMGEWPAELRVREMPEVVP